MGGYVVTARKWRPMRFEDVVGQEHVTTTLRNAIRTGRLAHAYIFSGPRGVGKTTTARLLAKAVNCLHPENANPDNSCDRCLAVNEGRSFDVLEIDGASNRGVEEIRNLREAVKYPPAQGPYRVYIIDEVHMLTKEAFNALLKTLEEPPSHVLFVFATTELHKLPATILSRCQRFEFRRIPVEQIKANLAAIAQAEQLTLDDESLQLIARRGDGSLRDAQSAFDMVISLCGPTVTHELILQALNVVDQELYFRVSDLVRERNTSGALALVQEVVDRGYDLKEFIGGLVEHFRNLLVVRATGSAATIEASDSHRRRYAEEAQKYSLPDLLRCQRLVSGTEASFRWVTQPRFKLEADMVLLMSLPAAAEVGEVLRSIDDLKKKLTEAPGPGRSSLRAPGVNSAPVRTSARAASSAPPSTASEEGYTRPAPLPLSSGSSTPYAPAPGHAGEGHGIVPASLSSSPSVEPPSLQSEETAVLHPGASSPVIVSPGATGDPPEAVPGAAPVRTLGMIAPGAETAAPQPLVSPPGINEGEVKSRWKEFGDLVRQKRISLGTVIDAIEPLGVSGNLIRVRCPDSFHADAIVRNREALSGLLEELFHRRARLEPVIERPVDTGAGTPGEIPAEEHPVIRALKRELGAEPFQA